MSSDRTDSQPSVAIILNTLICDVNEVLIARARLKDDLHVCLIAKEQVFIRQTASVACLKALYLSYKEAFVSADFLPK